MTGGPFLRTLFASGVQTIEAAFGYDLTTDPATWVWTDITTAVQWDPGAAIQVGYSDESQGLVSASLSASLGTRSIAATNFLINNPTGTYWPNVKENVPIRAKLNIGGGDAVRFQGYATSFAPVRDAGQVIGVDLLANGVARRLKQGKSTARSPMWRFNMLANKYPTNTNGGDGGDFGIGAPDYNGTGQGYHAAPVHYWPCEDRSGALQATNAVNSMYPLRALEPDHQPSFSARTVGQGSEPIIVLGDGAYLGAQFPGVSLGADTTGLFPTYSTVCVTWLMHIPELPTQDAEILRVLCTGTVGAIVLVWDYDPGDPTHPSFRVDIYDQAGTLLTSSALFDDSVAVNVPLWTVLRIDQQGSSVVVELDYATFQPLPNDGTIYKGSYFANVSVASRTVGTINTIVFGNNLNMPDIAIGHVGIYNGGLGALPTTSPRAVLGRRGDTADWRINRTSLEDGVPVTITGSSDIVLGPQKTGGYLDIVSEAATGDGGMLLDGLGPGMLYICRTQAYSLAAGLTLVSGAGAMIPGELRPEGDDRYRVNQFTANNPTGSEQTYTKTTGTLSTAQVGTYDSSGDICVALDATLLDHAAWRVAQGTVSGLRYPGLEMQLAKPATSAIAASWLAMLPFQRVDVTNLEPGTTQPNRSFLLRGWSERWNSKQWGVTMNVTPYDAYEVGVLVADSGSTEEYMLRVDDDGLSTLAVGVSAGAASLSVQTSGGVVWINSTTPTPNYADDIVGMQVLIDGIIVNVTAITGATSPQTFTVTGVTKALGAGKLVELYTPPILGL